MNDDITDKIAPAAAATTAKEPTVQNENNSKQAATVVVTTTVAKDPAPTATPKEAPATASADGTELPSPAGMPPAPAAAPVEPAEAAPTPRPDENTEKKETFEDIHEGLEKNLRNLNDKTEEYQDKLLEATVCLDQAFASFLELQGKSFDVSDKLVKGATKFDAFFDSLAL